MRIAKYAIPATLAAVLGGSALLISPTVQAEQLAGVSAAAPTQLSRTARVDFQITIPRFLRFRVGAPAAAIDLIQFAPTADEVGTGTSNPATAGGDAGVGQVTVQVRSNAGQINITATATGALTFGANTISYAEITTATSAGVIPAPVLTNGVSAPAPVTLNGPGNVTNRDAVWTYAYANTTVPEAGTYGGTVALNGRITYTATSP